MQQRANLIISFAWPNQSSRLSLCTFFVVGFSSFGRLSLRCWVVYASANAVEWIEFVSVSARLNEYMYYNWIQWLKGKIFTTTITKKKTIMADFSVVPFPWPRCLMLKDRKSRTRDLRKENEVPVKWNWTKLLFALFLNGIFVCVCVCASAVPFSHFHCAFVRLYLSSLFVSVFGRKSQVIRLETIEPSTRTQCHCIFNSLLLLVLEKQRKTFAAKNLCRSAM